MGEKGNTDTPTRGGGLHEKQNPGSLRKRRHIRGIQYSLILSDRACWMQTVNKFTPSLWAALQRTFSPGRLAYYLNQVNGDQEKAFLLHGWNTDLSAALYVPLQGFEITLRNSLDGCVTKCYREEHSTGEWYEDLDWVRTWCPQHKHHPENEIESMTKATKRLRKRRRLTHDNFVAGTTFGLWVAFLSRDYARLWDTALTDLHGIFPPGGTDPEVVREKLWHLSDRVKYVRNRVDHYEPIVMDARLCDLHSDIIDLLQARCPEISAWVADSSKFNDVLAAKPAWWNFQRIR